MKRLTVFLKTAVLSLFATLLAACASVVAPEPAPASEAFAQTLTLQASLEGHPQTRTVIQEETQVFWEPGDAVKLFFGGADGRFSSTNTEPAGTASFTGTLNVLIGFNEGASPEHVFWGLYPWREDATADETSVTTTLPAQQTALSGSFASDTYITLGRSQNLSMGFWGVCGGLRFSLTQEGIRQVDFESLGGEPLAGRIRVGFEDGVPTVQEVADGRSRLTLTLPGGKTFSPGEWYYFVALPGTLEKGFRLTFRKGTRSAEYTDLKAVTLRRAVFGSLSEVDRDLAFTVPGGGADEDLIHFADEGIKAKLVAAFDTNGNGELSFGEARAVTSVKGVFGNDNGFTSFDEFRYFTGVTTIPDLMFRGWTRLTSVWIPDSVTDIGKYAFFGCTALTGIEIPESVTLIGRNAFNGCSSLTHVTLPDTVSEVGDWAFAACTSLDVVEIPESVSQLGSNAFNGCSALTDVSLPESVTTLPAGIFQNCPSLERLTFPRSISAIGNAALAGCKSLQDITIPVSVTSIGARAFEGCARFTRMEIPVAVATLGSSVLKGCTGLKAIYVRPAVPPVGGDQMFDDTGDCPIYVPGASSQAYAEAANWKAYVNRLQSDDGSPLYYTSTDYSRDGEVITLQSASVGRGVNFVLLGDGFVDRDMETGGAYEQRMRSAMEALFAYEPYRSLRERFNVYTVKVVSANAQYNSEQSNRRLTYESGGSINFRSDISLQYAGKAPKGGGGGQPVKVAVLCNSTTKVGRSYCIRYSSGQACCIVFDPNPNVLVHELCGHGFGDLWDEYTENSETFTDHDGLDRDWTTRAWGANTDWRSDPTAVRWAHLLADSRYAGEGLGVFEGAKLYAKGIYRPSNNSMMRHNNCPFNAPSREQIYKNIMKWSVGSGWTYDYETFAALDAAGREQAAGKLYSASSLNQEQALEQRHADSHIPPVLADESVREVGFPVSGPAVPHLVRK